MKAKFVLALTALALSVVGFAFPQFHPHISSPKTEGIIRGQLLIKVKPSMQRMVQTGRQPIAGLPAGSQYINTIGSSTWTLWAIPAKADPVQLAAAARKDPSVMSAEPVYAIRLLLADPNDWDWNTTEIDDGNSEVILDFGDNDLSFQRLWHLDDDFAFDAWSVYPGTYYTSLTKPVDCPMIAVIDSGCDMFHPDFINAGGSTTNTAGGGQLNWALSRHFNLGAPDGGSWNDDNGHGTHVTGLALASANNGGFVGHGVPGLGYNAQGMILKVAGQDGGGSDADASAAIYYAVDNGADIINISLGETMGFSQLFQDACTYAWQKGVLVVAAGNENGDGGGDLGPIYPAACSGVLGVTGTGPEYNPATATYAGYGSYVDVAAPGGDFIQGEDYIEIQYIWSTAMETPGGTNSLYDLSQQGVLYPPYHLDYAYLAGTSMACPQVAGAAALYYGAYGLRHGQGHVNMRAYRAIERTAFGALGAAGGGWEPVEGYGCLIAGELVYDDNARDATVGGVEGLVYDGGTPIANAQVRASRTGFTTSTTTAQNGTYRFDAVLTPGVYTITTAPFGHTKSKKVLVVEGSDATGVDLYANGDPWDSDPPVVPSFSIQSSTSNSVTLSQWGYDPESGIDSLTIRIGTSVGAQDVYPDTELVTESSNPTIAGLSLPSGTYYLRATYTNGALMSTTVDRTFTVGAASVTGTITLQDYTGAPPLVTALIRNPGSTTTLQTITFTPAANGSFTFNAPNPGTYDIAFKASHWLRKVVANVVITGAGASGLVPSLINGDINGDNVVSLADFSALRNAFNSSPGDGNWNPNADLNGNLNVSLADFSILRNRFNLIGDP